MCQVFSKAAVILSPSNLDLKKVEKADRESRPWKRNWAKSTINFSFDENCHEFFFQQVKTRFGDTTKPARLHFAKPYFLYWRLVWYLYENDLALSWRQIIRQHFLALWRIDQIKNYLQHFYSTSNFEIWSVNLSLAIFSANQVRWLWCEVATKGWTLFIGCGPDSQKQMLSGVKLQNKNGSHLPLFLKSL